MQDAKTHPVLGLFVHKDNKRAIKFYKDAGFSDELEQRVQDRTADLAEANTSLQSEVAERRAAEGEILRRALRQPHDEAALRRGRLLPAHGARGRVEEHVHAVRERRRSRTYRK